MEDINAAKEQLLNILENIPPQRRQVSEQLLYIILQNTSKLDSSPQGQLEFSWISKKVKKQNYTYPLNFEK